jgi:excisionase family DNA binding protein
MSCGRNIYGVTAMTFIASTHQKQNAIMPDLAEFMTTQEAAKALGFHVKSIPKMVRDNILEGTRFGRIWLVSRKSVQKYLEKTDGMSKTDPRRKKTK